MKYGIMLILLGVTQLVFARDAGSLSWFLCWSGGSWILAGCAYGIVGARVFGKREDGRLAWWSVLLLFPFLAETWLLWHLQSLLTSEPHHVEVAPGIWLGRRCGGNQLPSGVKLVVDLTAEFAEPGSVRTGRSYLCVPTLDASVPSPEAFRDLIQAITVCQEPVYIHCALGHGRSATVVVAALVARGNAATLEEAEHMVKRARPGIKINPIQRNLLKQWYLLPPPSPCSQTELLED